MSYAEAPRIVDGAVDRDPTTHQELYWGLRRRLDFNDPEGDLHLTPTFRLDSGKVPVDITIARHNSLGGVFLGIRFDGHKERRLYSPEGQESLTAESDFPPPEGLKQRIDDFISQLAGIEL